MRILCYRLNAVSFENRGRQCKLNSLFSLVPIFIFFKNSHVSNGKTIVKHTCAFKEQVKFKIASTGVH